MQFPSGTAFRYFDDFDRVGRFDDFLFDDVILRFVTFDIREYDLAICPKFEEVADISNATRQIKRHLSQEKLNVPRFLGQAQPLVVVGFSLRCKTNPIDRSRNSTELTS